MSDAGTSSSSTLTLEPDLFDRAVYAAITFSDKARGCRSSRVPRTRWSARSAWHAPRRLAGQGALALWGIRIGTMACSSSSPRSPRPRGRGSRGGTGAATLATFGTATLAAPLAPTLFEHDAAAFWRSGFLLACGENVRGCSSSAGCARHRRPLPVRGRRRRARRGGIRRGVRGHSRLVRARRARSARRPRRIQRFAFRLCRSISRIATSPTASRSPSIMGSFGIGAASLRAERGCSSATGTLVFSPVLAAAVVGLI